MYSDSFTTTDFPIGLTVGIHRSSGRCSECDARKWNRNYASK